MTAMMMTKKEEKTEKKMGREGAEGKEGGENGRIDGPMRRKHQREPKETIQEDEQKPR